jgi:hypothetical protein
MSPRFLDTANINTLSFVALHGMTDISDSNIDLPLLHHIRYLDTKSSTCSFLLYGSLRQALVDPSSITIMIHTMIYLLKFEITNPSFLCLSLGSLSFSQGQLQVGSLSTTFSDPLTCFFHFGGEDDLHKLSQDPSHSWEH